MNMNSVTIRNNINIDNGIISNSIVLTLSNAAMILFVVMAGEEYPDYGYPFAVGLAIFSVIIYFLMYVLSCLYYNEQFSWNLFPNNQITNKDKFNIIFIGIFWGINYVFVLVSNPYVPGLIQIILNETNLIIIFLISKYWNKKDHNCFHGISVLIVLIGGIAHILGNAFLSNNEQSKKYSFLWEIAFFVGTVSIALANIITESVVQKFRTMNIFLLYFYLNLISVIVCGIFYFPVKYILTNTDEVFIVGITKIVTFEGLGAFWSWGVWIFTVPSNVLTSRLSRIEDATFSTVMLSIAPGISAIFMSVKSIFQKYYKNIIWTDFASLILVVIGAILYKAPELYRYFQINNNNDNISQEPLVRKYSDTDSYQNDETVNNNAIKIRITTMIILINKLLISIY